MAEYQGHKSRHHWNVSLHLYNDYSSYQMVLEACKRSTTRKEAARRILAHLGTGAKTPDGYLYTLDTVSAAIDEERLKEP
jgi:hypothetical protein